MITIESYYSGSEAICYLVKNGDTTILLDCGIEIASTANEYKAC